MKKIKFVENDLNLKLRVSEVIQRLEIPTDLCGYEFIKSGIIISLCNDSYLDNISCRLYSDIAKKFNTNEKHVEDSISFAIRIAFYRGDSELLKTLFRSGINHRCGIASNIEFITNISDILRAEIQMENWNL